MDKWILACTQSLIMFVKQEMKGKHKRARTCTLLRTHSTTTTDTPMHTHTRTRTRAHTHTHTHTLYNHMPPIPDVLQITLHTHYRSLSPVYGVCRICMRTRINTHMLALHTSREYTNTCHPVLYLFIPLLVITLHRSLSPVYGGAASAELCGSTHQLVRPLQPQALQGKIKFNRSSHSFWIVYKQKSTRNISGQSIRFVLH